jgi:DNA-binding transcriptional LysR family regulator
MDRLHLMMVFVAVGEEESFVAAARRLTISPPTVTRAISALEDVLGVKLLQRTTRNVRLTEAGRRYLDDVRNIMMRIEEANEAVIGVNAVPRGQLNVTAPVLFGKLFVMPSIVEYLNCFPGMEVAAFFLDSAVNLVEEGMDVAVRIGPLPDSGLRSLRVGQCRRVLCASPAYLATYGVPQHPVDLLQHTIIAASSVSPSVEWKFGPDCGPTLTRMHPRLTVTSNDAAIEAARQGLGITRLLSYQIASHLAAGELEILLAEYENAPLPIQVLHRESKYGSSKVRNFIDLLVEKLRADKHLN